MTYARRFFRSCRPLLCHLNRLGLYLSNYQRSPFPESPQHSSAGCFTQNLNFFWGYTFPHEIIKQHQMTISISSRIQGQLWWALLCNVSILCCIWTKRDRKLCRKQHVKIDKSRSLTSPRSPRNTRVHPCLLLSTLTLIIYSCPHWHWEKHPLTVSHMYTCAILFSRNRGMYAFHIISSTLHSRTST